MLFSISNTIKNILMLFLVAPAPAGSSSVAISIPQREHTATCPETCDRTTCTNRANKRALKRIEKKFKKKKENFLRKVQNMTPEEKTAEENKLKRDMHTLRLELNGTCQQHFC